MKASLAVLLATAVACTPQGQYEFYRQSGEAQAECDTKRTQQETQTCLEAYDMSYEEVQRLRDEVVD